MMVLRSTAMLSARRTAGDLVNSTPLANETPRQSAESGASIWYASLPSNDFARAGGSTVPSNSPAVMR